MLECVIIDDDSVGLYHLVTVYRLTSAVACGNGRGCKKKRKKTLVKKKLEHLKIGCAVPKKGAGRKRQRSASGKTHAEQYEDTGVYMLLRRLALLRMRVATLGGCNTRTSIILAECA